MGENKSTTNLTFSQPEHAILADFTTLCSLQQHFDPDLNVQPTSSYPDLSLSY